MPPPFSNKITQDTPPPSPTRSASFPPPSSSSQTVQHQARLGVSPTCTLPSLSSSLHFLARLPTSASSRILRSATPPAPGRSLSRLTGASRDWGNVRTGAAHPGRKTGTAQRETEPARPPPRLSHLSVAPPCSRATWSPGPVRHPADSALSCRSKVLISVCGTNGQMRASRITSTFHHYTPRLFPLPLLPPGLAATPSSLF